MAEAYSIADIWKQEQEFFVSLFCRKKLQVTDAVFDLGDVKLFN